ncbi:hypothetical protein E2C01_006519 [Portunus trituberculatus]|uniref:Uncharacterized protein n=1 Tax=Portunus trituberculatus TaxID=210409 RepID=A0A5B7CXK2_PORTR|nr:hypothetical protein [Portunus trituberculatus]
MTWELNRGKQCIFPFPTLKPHSHKSPKLFSYKRRKVAKDNRKSKHKGPHSCKSSSSSKMVRRTPLLVHWKVRGGCGWTIFLKKDQAWETEMEKDREAQKEAHAKRFSSRITRLHWASR